MGPMLWKEHTMMNNDDRLLAHKRSVDRHRQAQAILRKQHRQHVNVQSMARVAQAPR